MKDMPNTILYYHIDAFTEKPFRGNPAAVCLLPVEAEETAMQSLATEFGLSETAYVVSRAGGYGIRWFTPRVEVELCGHATLASAFALWDAGRADPKSVIRFESKGGPLAARKDCDWIELDFPLRRFEAITAPAPLLRALGANPIQVGVSGEDCLVELESEEAVRDLTPDFAALMKVRYRGVIVTSRAETDGFDFVSRFFAPRAGIPEDPATGSAHCSLAPYWQSKLGKDAMTGWQASPRGAMIGVRVAGNRVILRGKARLVAKGVLGSGVLGD